MARKLDTIDPFSWPPSHGSGRVDRLRWHLSRHRRRTPAWLIGLGIGPAGLLVLLALGQERIDTLVLTGDIFSLASVPFYSGLLSNLGVFLWCAAAAVSLFVATLTVGRPELRRFRHLLFAFGMLSALFMLDDFFTLHENVLPYFLGVPEEVSVPVYGALMLAAVLVFLPELRDVGPALLIAAMGCFALSIGADVMEYLTPARWPRVMDAMAKFVGISAWTTFVVRCAWLVAQAGRGRMPGLL
ncbi:hypothetical protein [Marinivivus vitaminiproducens]|uniref:hypothetical protein n=1 Tax=Marinivivus vitaminiproducens TaxID=3035935 RepID=UPI0027A1899B|nr:hypothetical protein P4R82_01725 [Geminicoccaceae bacterium SCSIO 64248]